MSNLTVHNQRFWIDGRPLLLQAGEFHYFRTPADQWEHRLRLLTQAGFNAVACYIPWLWHQPQPEMIDLSGTTHPMRDLTGFLDLAQRMGLYIIARPGPYIMAETINEGIPPWVFERYPQIALINQRGETENIASYLHPDFLHCAAEWYRAVFAALAPRQITRGGAIVLVQLDNEMGMLHWVRNSFDLNPVAMQHFANWLNAHNGAEPASDPVTLAERLRRAEGAEGAQLVAAYRRFYRSYVRNYARWLLDTAHANGLETPAVINIHGFANGGKTFPIGLSQLADALRMPSVISATDVYPGQIGEGTFHQLVLVNAMTVAIQNPAQPLFSIEFQAGGNLDFSNMSSAFYDLHTRLCLSNGMRAINHYLFFDGENDPLLSPVKRHDWGHPVRKDGTLRSHYHRYPLLSRTLASYGEALTLARPETVTAIGFRLDDFMTEVNLPCTQEETNIITHQREVILFDFIARGLALSHRDFTAIELQQATLDPRQTPLLWVMLDTTSDPATERSLVEYARAGGKVVIIGRLREAGELAKALNIQIASNPPFTPRRVNIFDIVDIPASFVQRYHGKLSAVFATVDGAPVGFRKTIGNGEIIVLGAAFPIVALDDLAAFNQLADWVDCPTPFTLSQWADVRLSRGPAGDFLFINHYGDDPLETHISYRGTPLCDGHPIQLPARSGAILPLNWRVRPGLTVRYATAEVRSMTEDDGRLGFAFAQPTGFVSFEMNGATHTIPFTNGSILLHG